MYYEKNTPKESPMTARVSPEIRRMLKDIEKFSPIKTLETLGLNLKKKPRGYPNKTILSIILIATLLARSIESIVDFLTQLNAREKISADNLLRLMKSMTLDALERTVNDMLRKMVKHVWWKKRATLIAFDITDELFYGNSKTKHVKATKPRKGTSRAFRFLIGSIVSRYGKFVVYIHLLREDEDLLDALKTGIRHVRTIVKIGTILLDRGFFSVKTLRMLLSMRHRFIMALPQTESLRKLNLTKSCIFRHRFTSKNHGSVIVWVVARIDDKRNPIFYAVLSRKMVRKPSDTHWTYQKKRWRIEINNKMIKLYKARTSSRDPRIRFFLFAFSCLIYNSWLISGFNMVKSAKKKLNAPIHYRYYSVWSILVAFHTILRLL